MTLYEKIISIYPDLLDHTEYFYNGKIILQDDSDGNGAYIQYWNCEFPAPTQEQLAAL